MLYEVDLCPINKIASLGLGALLLRPSWRSWLDLLSVCATTATMPILVLCLLNPLLRSEYKSQISSLQFAVTGMLMKIFRTKCKDIVDECMSLFYFATVDILVYKRKHNFLFKLINAGNNSLCKLFANIAAAQKKVQT